MALPTNPFRSSDPETTSRIYAPFHRAHRSE
jgi:hypothetical protein